MENTTPEKTTSLAFGSYKGTPTITFSDGKDRFPFSFGPAKARKLLKFMEEHGVETFMKALTDLAVLGAVTKEE